MIKLVILLLVIVHVASGYSLIDISPDNDWDSSLYGKPVCMAIPSNMSLCRNINYNQMKVPNLLGHDSIDEIVYQSSVWMPLLKVNCHVDTQLFLCSLFAPVCVDQQPQTQIYPCRSLCEAVKQSCEAPMLSYNYPWPSMFNCSRFPDDNGLCVPTSSGRVTTTTTTTITSPSSTTSQEDIIASTTTQPSTTTSKPAIKPSKPDSNRTLFTDNYCLACDEETEQLEEIVHGYCNSDIALRGRIQSIKISRLDTRKHSSMYQGRNRSRSLLLNIDRRDRRFFKGLNLISNAGGLKNFLNEYPSGLIAQRVEENDEDSDEEEDYEEEELQNTQNLSIYLLSGAHLHEASLSNELAIKKAMSARNASGYQSSTHRGNSGHCVCDKVRKAGGMRQHRRVNVKFLLMANIVKSKNFFLNEKLYNMLRRNRKRDLEDDLLDVNSRSTIKLIRSNGEELRLEENHHEQSEYSPFQHRRGHWMKRQASRTRSNKKQPVQLMYMTNFVLWNKAQSFIDFLEDDSISKRNMCKNIKRTVKRINRMSYKQSQLLLI